MVNKILSPSVLSIEDLIKEEDLDFLEALKKCGDNKPNQIEDYISNVIQVDKKTTDTCSFYLALKELKESGIDRLHIDVMTDESVNNNRFETAYKANLIKEMARVLDLKLDVHVMSEHVEKYLDLYNCPQTDAFTFHPEYYDKENQAGGEKTSSMIERIKQYGIKAGIAMNPDAPYLSKECMDAADLLLFMTVRAGAGNQPFQEQGLDNLKRALRENPAYELKEIQVDGGMKIKQPESKHLLDCLDAGCNNVVIGSAIIGDYLNKKDLNLIKRNVHTAKFMLNYRTDV
jgi:ribulose-phosphate 3-epimerase